MKKQKSVLIVVEYKDNDVEQKDNDIESHNYDEVQEQWKQLDREVNDDLGQIVMEPKVEQD